MTTTAGLTPGDLPRVVWIDGRANWFHMCRSEHYPDWGEFEARTQLNRGGPGWDCDEATDTVSPSLLCTGCGTHGFWTAGKWVPA